MQDTGFITNGNPWHHPHAARAICPDGQVRIIRLTQAPDTFFSWSGRGRAERGMVYESDGVLRFEPYDKEI